LAIENRLQTEVRKQRRLRALGDHPSCELCGESDPEALTRCNRTIIEENHVGGISNDAELTQILCLNCHRKVTELQREFGVELCHYPRNLVERMRNVLKGLAASRIAEAERFLDWDAEIEKLTRALDEKFPDWRKLPEAQ
jgi:hypothetical protein